MSDDQNARIGAYAGAGGRELPDGHDRFLKTQKPDVTPVDDLSRFVLLRIMELELEPRGEIDPLKNPEQAMAYRYARHVRRDCVAFRRILATYAEFVNEVGFLEQREAYTSPVLAIANRWADHYDFRAEWGQV